MRRSWLTIGLAWLIVATGCASPRATPQAAQEGQRDRTGELHYTFAFDEELRHLRARLCFDGPAPAELSCGVAWGAEFLKSAHAESTPSDLDSGGARSLPLQGGRIQVRGVPPGGCIRYVVDVGEAAERFGALRAERREGALMSNLTLWLWRPAHPKASQRATARFVLPPGMRVSVPWPRAGKRYALDASAFRFLSYGVVGAYELEQVSAGGAQIDIAVLGDLPASTRAHVAPWIESAAWMASLPGGHFPGSRALVVVVAAPAGNSPVGFGHVVRGGGASVGIFLRENADLAALKSDWVAVHEFSHLWHPFVEREDAWLSEGLATYYQEVLRARAGVTDDLYAWQRLWEGSLKGKDASGSLARESAQMFATRSFPRVYWAGAAFALMADVALRRRSGGEQSLDGVLDALEACCSQRISPQPAHELIARMDRIAGGRLFRDLYERWVLGPELPDLGDVYAALGLSVAGGSMRELDAAPDAWIRHAIMRRNPRVAQRVAAAR